MERGSWADHGTEGYFIEPAPRHYRNFTCWIPTTNATLVSNTVEFFPADNKLTVPDRLDRMGIILQQLLDLLQEPNYNNLLPMPTEELLTTICGLRELFGVETAPTTSKGVLTPLHTPRKDALPYSPTVQHPSPGQDIYCSPDRPLTRTAHVYQDGTII